MHALIIGATGATGKDLLNLLLKDKFFQRVDVFVRRDMDLQHEKLHIHVINFDKEEEWKYLLKGDVLFSCLGTTLKAAGSKEAQWKIDYDYQYNFAKTAKANNVSNYILVSSDYASATSPVFYSKMKGQLEEAVKALHFPSLSIFNPPALIRKNSDRPNEISGVKVLTFLNKLGIFRSLAPLSTEVLAQAMINAAKTNKTGIFTYKREQIRQCANENV